VVVRALICRAFVGREDESAYLLERRREAAASRGGLVLVRGEAGVGKSRLLAEFRDRSAKASARIAFAQCNEFAGAPFAPIADVLRRIGLSPVAGEFADAYDRLVALVAAFERAAERKTVVAVVEDVHLADAATLAFFAHLVPRLANMRALFVLTYRPEALHAGHPTHASLAALSASPGVGRIDLAPFEETDLHTFVGETLGEIVVHRDTLCDIARVAEGNPFFTEELLRNAVEAQRRNVTGAERATLPTSIGAVLVERLAPFEPSERAVLAQAAVIGRVFDLELLAESLDRSSDALLPTLRRARDYQLIEETGPTSFRFRHGLTRDAIYGSFLRSEVARLHHRIATLLESRAVGDASIESLAYHWTAAGDRERAFRYNESAGDAARRLFAHDDAVAAYERALAALCTLDTAEPSRAALLEKIAESRIALGSDAAALTAYDTAAAVYECSGDVEKEARCLVRVATLRFRAGDPDARVPLETFLARESETDDRMTAIRVRVGLAHIEALRFEATREAQLARIDERTFANDDDLTYAYRATRAIIAYMHGDTEAFRGALEIWLAAARTANARLVAMVHNFGALYFASLGAFDESGAHAGIALEIARARNDRMLEASSYAASAWQRMLRGDLAGVRDAVDAMRALATESSLITAHACAWGTLAGLHLGDARLVASSFDRFDGAFPTFGASIYAAGFAEMLVARGRTHDARLLLHRAIDYGDRPRGIVFTLLALARFGDPADLPRARDYLVGAADAPAEVAERYALDLFDAYVARRDGDAGAATSRGRRAADGFARLRLPLLEAASLEIAGDVVAAVAIFRRLGANGDLARLGRLISPEVAVARAARDLLSAREREVARFVARGGSNLEIARALSISAKTVEKHLGSIYAKLALSSRVQLAMRMTAEDAEHLRRD